MTPDELRAALEPVAARLVESLDGIREELIRAVEAIADTAPARGADRR